MSDSISTFSIPTFATRDIYREGAAHVLGLVKLEDVSSVERRDFKEAFWAALRIYVQTYPHEIAKMLAETLEPAGPEEDLD